MGANPWCCYSSDLRFPQGLRDPLLPIAYIQSENTVKAIRLTDGDSIWKYATKGRPIAVLDGRLAIQVGDGQQAFRVEVVDKASGILVIRSDSVFFSQPAGPRLNYPTPSVSASLSDNVLLLHWRIQPRYTGGANPPAEFAKPLPGLIVRAKMDLTTGRVLVEPGEADSPQKVTAEKEEPRSSIPNVARYLRNGDWRDEPWKIDGASLALIEGADSRRLYLEIRKEKEAPLTKEVRAGLELANNPPYVSDDGKYVILAVKQDEWAVYSSVDGHQVGRFVATSLSEPCVVGDRIYYRAEKAPSEPADVGASMLIAQDLATGKLVWSQTLAVRHRGTRPKLPQ